VLALRGDGRLDGEPRQQRAVCGLTDLFTAGRWLLAGKWCPYGVPGRSARGSAGRKDARQSGLRDHGFSEPLEILGEIVLELDVESDKPVAMIAARLNAICARWALRRASRMASLI